MRGELVLRLDESFRDSGSQDVQRGLDLRAVIESEDSGF
jgi:hypothetical protein